MEMRERILVAAERVIRARGLARATTAAIAREAACSEGTLYNHFANKEELFLTIMRERLPPFVALALALPDRAGSGTVPGNLAEVATAALAFHDRSLPLSISLFSEPELLARHRERLRAMRAGPHKPGEAVAAYLRAEQRLGRVRGGADSQAAADLLLGACLQRAFNRQFLLDSVIPEDEARFIRGLLDALAPIIGP